MTSSPIDDLRTRLLDREYAKAFGGEVAKSAFAATLAQARRESGLSQQEVAVCIGASQPYVARLESGEANPTLGRVGQVLGAMNLRLVTSTEPLEPRPIRDTRPDVAVSVVFGNATEGLFRDMPALWEAGGVRESGTVQSEAFLRESNSVGVA